MDAALPRRRLTRPLRALPVAVALFAWVWLFASPAGAHSFLVSTAPAQGQRLAGPPEAVVLEFSEAVDLAAAHLEVRTADGDALATAKPELASGELAVRLPLPDLDDHIYIVTWEAVSAADGHGTSGEFAFGVGEATGEIPAPSSDSPTSRWSTVSGWLFFAGFAVSAGGLAFRVLADRAAAPTAEGVRSRGRNAVRTGLFVAAAGATVAVVALPAGAAAGTTLLALGTVGLLATASLLCTFTRQPLPPLGALFGAAATWSAVSHAANAEGFTGGVVDFVHLAAGGMWAGLLGFVAAELWSSRRRGTPLAPVVARYARLAVGLVIVLGAAGVISAYQLLNSWSDLVDTGYGRLILAKSVLFTLALWLASLSRWRGIARGRPGLLRRAVTAEGVTVAVVLVLAGLLVGGAPPIPASTAAALLGPAPLEGAVARDAGLAGQLNVEVATEGRRLDIDVFSPDGPVAGTRIEASASEAGREDQSLVTRPCGPGCFTQAFTPHADATTVTVEATAPGWEGGTFDAVLTWPPGPTAGDRLAAVIATMRAIPTLEMTETVTSGPGSVVTPSTFTLSGEELMAAEPYGAGNVEARVAGGGGNTLRLYLAGSQVFAELRLDDLDRITSARMVTPSHDIRRTFSYPPP